MMFTSIALMGAAAAWALKKSRDTSGNNNAVAGRTKGNTAAEREALTESNRAKAAEVGVTQAGGRTRPPEAPVIGKAVTRTEYAKRLAETEAGEGAPDAGKLASANMVSAYAAGERARKRAAAGGTVLTKAQRGMPGPKGSYAQKTLLGS